MSMTKEALEHIEENAIAASDKAVNMADYPFAVLPSGMKIHDIEKYQTHRYRFRGTLATHLIESFAAYANQQNEGSCFIDTESMSAKAIFDIGSIKNPGHCEHKASLGLRRTAEYNAISNIFGKPLSQQDFAEFIEDWGPSYLTMYVDDDVVIHYKDAAAAVRNLVIDEKSREEHNTQQFSVNKSAFEEINAKSKDKPLPGHLVFFCKPYVGLGAVDIPARISLIIRKNAPPEFIVRPIKIDTVREAIGKDFEAILSEYLDEKIKHYLGSFGSSG